MNSGYTLQASLIEQTLYPIKMGIKSTIIDLANVFGTMFKIDVYTSEKLCVYIATSQFIIIHKDFSYG